MKKLFIALAALTIASVAAAATPTNPATANSGVHRYLIERTFPIGALAGLDAAAKAKVNENNAKAGVRWIQSYASADQTRTFCIYEGPSETAIREASKLNNLPVDSVTEVPTTLTPG